MHLEPPSRIAILGAGPCGLETGLYARYLGYRTTIYEQGEIAQSVREWGHVRMFSPFCMNRSPLGLAAIQAQNPDSDAPSDNDLLTGHEWYQRYLLPLATSDLLKDHIRTGTKVLSVGKQMLSKKENPASPDRAQDPFRILIRDAQGQESIELAEAVIDTTGVWGQTNWLGPGGAPAIGEQRHAEAINYRLPDFLGADREHFENRRTLVIGAGFSAATNVTGLADLANTARQTTIVWSTRRAGAGDMGPLPEIADDKLPERARLTRAANGLATDPDSPVQYWPETWVESLQYDARRHQWSVGFEGARQETEVFDQILANVGFRPDRDVYRELQIHECYATEGPIKLAATLLGQESSDCLTISGAGPHSLVSPEPNFYILGAKSYGRNSQFLIAAGLVQIRDLFTLLGDRADLDLYESVTLG